MANAACSTKIKVSVSFGGHLWPVDPADMNIGTVTQGGSQCLGAIYELQPLFDTVNTDGQANWVFGSAFLVRCAPFYLFLDAISFPAEKRVHCVPVEAVIDRVRAAVESGTCARRRDRGWIKFHYVKFKFKSLGPCRTYCRGCGGRRGGHRCACYRAVDVEEVLEKE
jgi:hypothetical protein